MWKKVSAWGMKMNKFFFYEWMCSSSCVDLHASKKSRKRAGRSLLILFFPLWWVGKHHQPYKIIQRTHPAWSRAAVVIKIYLIFLLNNTILFLWFCCWFLYFLCCNNSQMSFSSPSNQDIKRFILRVFYSLLVYGLVTSN